MITFEQNVPQWFISRIFYLTASPAHKYLVFGLKDKNFEKEDHWVAINEYATNNPTSIPIPVVTTYRIAQNNAMEWAKEWFEDLDCNDWLSNPINLEMLHTEAVSNK